MTQMGKEELFRKLFIPTLTGYKGTVIKLTLRELTKKEENWKEFSEAFPYLYYYGCKLALSKDSDEIQLLVPDGFGAIQISIWMGRYEHDILS